MPPINVMIKPSSSNCNLNCKYCFYRDVAENRDKKSYGMMSEDTLEAVVKRVFEYGEKFVGFAFQGGEPTLVGLNFYKKLIDFEKKYNVKGLKVSNSIQTNGMLIDEEWAEFLSENNFLVGLSLDGPADIQNLNRIDLQGKGSFSRVAKTVEIFNKYKVEYNVLCTVTKAVTKHIEKIYRYYTKSGFKYLQFIPCLDELGGKPGENPYSLKPSDYESFLKKLFDLWYEDFTHGNGVSVRMFDNIAQMLLGYPPESCDMKGCCSVNTVIEADGSVYPCDFYVLNEWKLGNILNDDLQGMIRSEKGKDFVEISKGISDTCGSCEYGFICRGGCRRHYEPIKDGMLEKNYFCLAYKGFYKYSLDRFYHVVKIISSNWSH
ncbi:anaerobic sulfatase maturase [Clostridium beijerinckii]|uniref:Anaerobic sulfatase maturase n=1 Tax=Clostridium beijerinckii TaxID=1520 RepID=A0A0B5QNK7_CLOBE|nr:anaerobic sulfatase maturase [Clostridium beijerinckii]AJG99851.1 anaerobic sulfatase maturase [Clostridium beijerinckii]